MPTAVSSILGLSSLRGKFACHIFTLEVFLDSRNMIMQELLVKVLILLILSLRCITLSLSILRQGLLIIVCLEYRYFISRDRQ